ncbi:MAG: molybdopterin dinucleotide binding domain-containing protein, partial [Thermoanaerobaculia bacterium]
PGEDPAGGRFGATTEAAILALDIILGTAGPDGSIVVRNELPAPVEGAELAPVRELDRIPDRSLGLLIVDASAGDAPIPWPAIERKLLRGARVIALSPFLAGSSARADYVVPTPTFLESVAEVPGPYQSPRPELAISPAIAEPVHGTTDPAAFIRAFATASGIPLDGEWRRTEDLIRLRADRIQRSGEGRVSSPFDGSETAVRDLGSDVMFDALVAGARWRGEKGALPAPPSLLGGEGPALRAILADEQIESMREPQFDLTVVPRASRDVASTAVVSPLMTKLYRESGLRRIPGTAAIHPATAKNLGMRSGRMARIETASGSARVRILIDRAVLPGVVELEVAPDAPALGDGPARGTSLLDLCVDGSLGWRRAAARLVEG